MHTLSNSDLSVLSQVRSAIADMLALGSPPRRTQIARRLAMSERTLQRRMTSYGTTFQSVVSDLRDERARTLLSSRKTTLCEVALELGFSDQSAFQRAFKSWTGQTPHSFRMATMSRQSKPISTNHPPPLTPFQKQGAPNEPVPLT